MCFKALSKRVEQLDSLEKTLRGFYSNSFFHIYLAGDFNPVISDIALQKDKGTAIHEYTHYIQNIGTLWGLYNSIFMYECIIEFKKAITAANEITRPFFFSFSKALKKKEEFIRHGNGTTGLKCDINKEGPIDYVLKDVLVNGKGVKQIDVTFTSSDGQKQTVQLGAHIIKESMAALYQSLLDPEAQHNDVPYNLVKLIAEKHFPKTAKDTRKLICCCHASLFSMSPGDTLIKFLLDMESGDSDGFTMFNDFVHTSVVYTGKGVKKPMLDFFNDMVDGFKQMLKYNLSAPLDYIEMALDRVRLDGRFYPFLSVLYDGDGVFTDEDFSAIVGYYGIPYIQTGGSGIHYPQGKNENGEEGSADVIEMIVQEALFRNFVIPDGNDVCPLYYLCRGTQYEKPECLDHPWKGKMCAYKVVSDSLGLDKKTII